MNGAEYLTGNVPGLIMLAVLIIGGIVVYLRVSSVKDAVDEAADNVKKDVRETRDRIKDKLGD